MGKIHRAWTPGNWASLSPFGIGHQRPNNHAEVFRAAWENRDQMGYAWRILTQGVCDGCALGTAGLRDWTLDGVHLCNIRLRLLRLNTMPALDPARLRDIGGLDRLGSEDLMHLGRLPRPMIRRRGESGFAPIPWDDALDLIAGRIREVGAGRCGFYLTSRGMPNENYYAAQKAVRAMGTNSIDNAARICHSPSTVGLKAALGVAATTCSYSDWLRADLIVFIGSNVATNQPVATKYIHFAKKAGARVAAVNCHREPGMEAYWIPSLLESSLFGTKIVDRCFLIHMGADIAFLNGAVKHLIEAGLCDQEFIREHTQGFEALSARLAEATWESLEKAAGCPRLEMQEFARMVAQAERAVFVWSMGITQHEHGVGNVRAIINLALTRGFVGREGCGLMPIRGHSGVQGGAEMGCYATAFPGGLAVCEENARRMSEAWGFDVPAEPGLTAAEMIEAADRGDLDVLFSVGGNFLDVLPEPKHVREALGRVPLRVHMDIALSKQMLLEPAEIVILLPATTRYEMAGGCTETSTERRVIFSPEIGGPRVPEARPEWEVFMDLARRVRPEIADRLGFAGTAAIRDEIAQVIPAYAGIECLAQRGDQFQLGGTHLCGGWEFPTPDGKAHFAVIESPKRDVPAGQFLLSTRRGKQFNSIVHEHRDAVTGATREAALMNPEDMRRLGLRPGDAITLSNAQGSLRCRAFPARLMPGNVQVHWPEGNVLIDRRRRSPEAGVPDFNALVGITRVEAPENRGAEAVASAL